MTTDLMRPSIDPVDLMGDEEHHPDGPTEPLDQPEAWEGEGVNWRLESQGDKRVKRRCRGHR